MRVKRIYALAAAALLSVYPAAGFSASAAESESWIDFSEKWPDKFFDDDTVEVTENTYKSHDLNVRIDRHEFNRLTGDVDGNGEVEVADAIMALRYQAEDEVVITRDGLRNADVNEDGLFTAEDTAMMLGWLSGNLEDDEFFVDHSLVWFVIDFYVRSMENLRGAFAKGSYPESNKQVDSIEDMANENNAVFAINCDYCGFRDDGVIIRNGVTYRETYRSDLCLLHKDGVMDIVSDVKPQYVDRINDDKTYYRTMSDDEKANIWQSVTFYPPLVVDGEVCEKFPGGNLGKAHPRSGIGYFEPGHYCFIQVEGRQPGYSNGILLPDYAQMFKDLGCVEAFNMDGGSSSVIVFNGKQINKPAWNGRETSDILYLVDSAKIPEDKAAAAWKEKQSE